MPTACAAALASIVGCSGGSSDDPVGSELSGTVFADRGPSTSLTGEVYAIDPATGETRLFARPRPEEGSTDEYHNVADFTVGPGGGVGALLLGVTKCFAEPPAEGDSGSSSGLPSCVERIGPDGSVERLFLFTGRPYVAPAGSPDGTLIAMMTRPSYDPGPFELWLLDPQGTLLETRTLPLELFPRTRYDWTADNRLVYGLTGEGEGTFLHVSAPRSLAPEETWLVTEDDALEIDTISVSPDGRSIAYDLVATEAPVRRVRSYVLDRTSGETVPILTEVDYDVFEPEWSPDGRFVLVTFGFTDGGPGSVFAPVSPDVSLVPYEIVVEWEGASVEADPYEGNARLLPLDAGALGSYVSEVNRDRWVFGNKFWTR